MVLTSNCCYCFSLRTGTLIIGWLQVVGGILILGAGFTVTTTQDQGGDNTTSGGLSPRLLVICLQVIVGVILLYGVCANEKQFIYWYIRLQVVLIVISFLLDMFIFTSPDFSIARSIGTYTIMWLIQAYLLVVVHSFYKEIEDHV